MPDPIDQDTPEDLDPEDWDAFARLAHQMLDVALQEVREVRDRPVWRPVPAAVKQALAEPVPVAPQALAEIAEAIRTGILPYTTGNRHPRFWGWVHGSGTAGGIVAEMLAAALNANVGGRDHGAVHVERQVIDWCRTWFGFPGDASGLLVSGTSMATLIALAVARHRHTGGEVRTQGVHGRRLVGYTSAAAHSSVARAFELLGLGAASLRAIPVDADDRINLERLTAAIAADRLAGAQPFCVVGTAGTVNTGAIDDLGGLADLCAEQGLWFHVDGAFGALLALSETLKPRLAGLERADSLAFDFHKWLHVPYDAGCVLVRDGALHRAAFGFQAGYLERAPRGLAGGDPWFCEFGPELSRGFRALKVWFTLKEHGTAKLGRAIERNCAQARYLGARVEAEPALVLMAPVALNIVCFRYYHPDLTEVDLDQLNAEVVADLQEAGVAAPSTTVLRGRTVIRVNLTNHRTRDRDLDLLVGVVPILGAARTTLVRTCRAPELAAALVGATLAVDPGLDAPFRVTAARIAFDPAALGHAAAAGLVVRHALELRRWRQLAGDRMGAAEEVAIDLLAARVAARRWRGLGPAAQGVAAVLPGWLVAAYEILGHGAPVPTAAWSRDERAAVFAQLAGLRDGRLEPLVLAAQAETIDALVVALWDLAAPTDHLLVRGGGNRLAVDPASGLNPYGASPTPRPEALEFASSTASSPSPDAYAAAAAARDALIGAGLAGTLAAAWAAAITTLKAEILGVLELADHPGVEIVLTPSGTDGEYAALHLAQTAPDQVVTNIVIAPDETGSGVLAAAGGRHFGSQTPHGASVETRAYVDGIDPARVIVDTVQIRDAAGRPRAQAEIDLQVGALVDTAIAAGTRCLLHLLDGSKTGLRAPGLDAIRALQERHGDGLDVVVDACQLRSEPERLRGFLECGWMVLITGSKFFGGPPFAGALLVPARVAARTPDLAPLPKGLGAYFGRAAWPDGWAKLAASLPSHHNVGLLLRWRAALQEMRAFARVPAAVRREIIEALGNAIETAIAAAPHLDLIAAPAEPDAASTIFAFALCGDDRRRFDLIASKNAHIWLNRDLSAWLPANLSAADRAAAAIPCGVGQPVQIGGASDPTVVLRICIGARLVTAAHADVALGATAAKRRRALVAQIRLVVAKADLIARHYDRLAQQASRAPAAGSAQNLGVQ